MSKISRAGYRLAVTGAVGALVAAGFVGGAVPSQAAGLSVAFAPNSVVGVPASISISGATNGSSLGANVSFTINFSDGSNQAFNVQVDGDGTGTGTWLPASAGGFTAIASDGTNRTTDKGSVSQVSTTTKLTAPGSTVVNQPVTLQAIVAATDGSTYGPLGSVQFSIQGGATLGTAKLDGSTPSVATYTWTPSATGSSAIIATYEPANRSGATCSGAGCSSSAVTVSVTPSQSNVPDTIVVDPNGDPAPWSSTGANQVVAGTYALTTKTSSGGKVALSVTGAGCTLAGATLTITGTSGTCTLAAASPGGNGYAATTANFVLNIGGAGQTANLALPNSGRVARGRTITLAAPGQDTTNAGQVITWKVIGGAGACKLLYPADGSVKLRKVRRGTCTVAGSAPATSNLGPFYVQRSYSG